MNWIETLFSDCTVSTKMHSYQEGLVGVSWQAQRCALANVKYHHGIEPCIEPCNKRFMNTSRLLEEKIIRLQLKRNPSGLRERKADKTHVDSVKYDSVCTSHFPKLRVQ